MKRQPQDAAMAIGQELGVMFRFFGTIGPMLPSDGRLRGRQPGVFPRAAYGEMVKALEGVVRDVADV